MAANPYFKVSNTGKIGSPRRPDGVRLSKGGNNEYRFIKWRVDWKWHIELAHRAVAKAFVPNPEGKAEVNHKNGIKTDNRAENLEWVTRQENVNHSLRTGLTPMGDRHRASKLKERWIPIIFRARERGWTIHRIALLMGVSFVTIQRVINGEGWTHVKVATNQQHNLAA